MVGETEYGVAVAGIPGVAVARGIWRGVGYNLSLCYAGVASNYGE
jgi:hypothetical protein